MFELHQTLHDDYGICLWTLLAMIVFLIMVVILIVHLLKQNRRGYKNEKELEKIAEEGKAGLHAKAEAQAAQNQAQATE